MESPGLGLSVLGLLAVAVLVLTNAYFVATEFALVAVRRSQVTLWVKEGRRGAASVSHAITHMDDAIAATQLGITLASIALGWIGEPALASLLRPGLTALGLGSSAAVHTVAVAVAFAAITFLHVVVGELAPKAVALDRPGEVALWCARPLLVFRRLLGGVLVVMNGAGSALVRALGARPAAVHERVHSPEELHLLVDEARDAGMIRAYTGRILGNVFRLARTRVRDVMVPRARVFSVERGMDPEAVLDRLREGGYTRLPVYQNDLDTIVGILHTKDLFHLYAKRGVVILEDAIRPAMEIPPDLSVIDALRRFRARRRHLSIVREHGGPVLGIVTLEDVLEEIVGEIEDEHDIPTPAGVE
jgi:CBS domain containing-hemolysin-like protein